MNFFLFMALLTGIAVIPVMIGARIVKAQNTGFGAALLSVVVLAALSAAINHFIDKQSIAFFVAIAGGAFFLAGILGTSLLRGLAVSFIVVAIQFALILTVAAGLFGIVSKAAA